MHLRNPYRHPPDFSSLAGVYDPLKQHLIAETNSRRKTIDFKDGQAQRRLTEAIMFRDFGITLNIPPNRLCPPVPNRLNYVLWIQDIVHAHNEVLGTQSRSVRGIDIGTGSTAIYPFLACKMDRDWSMVATELDDESYASARANISFNNMEGRIDVRKASSDGHILFPLESESDSFLFSMCNPPFYASAQEVEDLAHDKEFAPNAVCTGTDIEMIYPSGGEVGFILRMVEESEGFQSRCKWYTSMLGKMSSVTAIVEIFRHRLITNYAITEFVQGQTRRWAIAWSFSDTWLPDTLARVSPSIGTSHALHPVLPPRNTLVQTFPKCMSRIHLEKVLGETLRATRGVGVTEVGSSHDGHKPTNQDSEAGITFLIETQGNTWSRSARRSKRNIQTLSSNPLPDSTANSNIPSKSGPLSPASANVTLTATVITSSTLVDASNDRVVNDVVAPPYHVRFQLVFGRDRGLFESFVSHVGRKVGTGLKEG